MPPPQKVCVFFHLLTCLHYNCVSTVCDLPMDMGVCLAYFPSWFHNSTSGECEMFTYGGCGGNGNRFQTLKACQARCDDDGEFSLHIIIICALNSRSITSTVAVKTHV